jgi:hypothetical protein
MYVWTWTRSKRSCLRSTGRGLSGIYACIDILHIYSLHLDEFDCVCVCVCVNECLYYLEQAAMLKEYWQGSFRYVCMCVPVCVCVCVCIHVFEVCMYVYVYVCVYTCMHICIHTYMHTYTHMTVKAAAGTL